MRISKSIYFFVLIFFLGCYSVEVRRNIPKGSLSEGRRVEAPTKIHKLNGDVVLCQNGFSFSKDTLSAMGTMYLSNGTVQSSGLWYIPIDSVSGIEYYDRSVPGANVLGSVLGVVTGMFIIKVVFGSCPTVYTVDGNTEKLEAECFSYSISRKFELPDLDRLNYNPHNSRSVQLNVKNEALETHYINKLGLCYVDHPEGTEVYPCDDQKVLMLRSINAPKTAVNSEGTDVLSTIRKLDDDSYQCDSATASRMFKKGYRDWIDCTVPIHPDETEATLVLRLRNTLFTTTLFYDVMLKNQGFDVFNWMDSVNTNDFYAWKLSLWYKQHSGIEVSVEENGSYVVKGKISNSGPIAWKNVAMKIPVKKGHDSIKVRLSFLTDNWQIDRVGFTTEPAKELKLNYADITEATDNYNTPSAELAGKLAADHDDYVVRYPGNWMHLTYALPELQSSNRTLFLASKGYYTEWMRPQWLRDGEKDRRVFDFSQKDEAMERTVQLWLNHKNTIERQFFSSKIPLAKQGETK